MPSRAKRLANPNVLSSECRGQIYLDYAGSRKTTKKNNTKSNMYLIGAGGHAKVVMDLIRMSGKQVDGLFDDDLTIKSLLNCKSLGTIKNARDLQGEFVIAIGNNRIRKNIAENLNLCYRSVKGNSNVSSGAYVGEGTVIMNGACINIDTHVGKHVIVNTGACVDHDCLIENYVHISPNATLAGNVSVGEGTQIGLGAQIIQGVTIGKWVTIGAGTVIIKDIPDYAVVVGVPGKIIKYNEHK